MELYINLKTLLTLNVNFYRWLVKVVRVVKVLNEKKFTLNFEKKFTSSFRAKTNSKVTLS